MHLPLLCSLWLFASSSSSIVYSKNENLNEGSYLVDWEYENNTETFYFKVRVKATGWIGFGVSRLLWPDNEILAWNYNSMRYYDVLVGGVDGSGNMYFKDLMTNGHLLPKEDEHQDWSITNITESNGTTTMEFSRKKNTGDAVGDNVIEPGWRRMVCAYHDSDDYDTSRSTFTKHTWEGYKAIEFIKVQYNAIQTLSTLPKEGFSVTMVPKEKAVLADYVTKPPTTGASTQAVSSVGHFLLLVIAVIFFY